MYYPGNNLTYLKQASAGDAVTGLRPKDESKTQKSIDSLTLPLVSMSPGGVEAILSHPTAMSHAAVPEGVGCKHGITFGLFCLNVGLGNSEGLTMDFSCVLREAFNGSFTEPIKGQCFSN